MTRHLCLAWSLIILTSLMATSGFARLVTEAEVRLAAEHLLAGNTLRQTLPNATIHTVTAFDGLWCVQLAPAGHLILSGSTRIKPLLSYSSGDYLPPPEGHPLRTIQADMRQRVRDAEASAAVTTFAAVTVASPTDAEMQWNNLLNPPALSLFSTPYTTQVGPLLSTAWAQSAPWNDLSPQHTAQSQVATNPTQGRAPLGCVATMYSQIMMYHAWPARFDAHFSNTLEATGCALDGDYEMRFHGGLPMDWAALSTTYTGYATPESKRLPIARLGLLTDILSDMSFSPNASGATLAAPCDNPWYTPGNYQWQNTAAPLTEAQLSACIDSLDKRAPIPASIPYHAIIIDGYAKDASNNTYLSLDYGWGGSNNGFYLASEFNLDGTITNHLPMQRVQLAALPETIHRGHTLAWAIPNYWKDVTSGFTVTATPHVGSALATWSDPASAITDPIANTRVFSTTYNDFERTNVFRMGTNVEEFASSCLLSGVFIPTSTSTFSCRSRAAYTLSHRLDVQIRTEANPQWTTITTLPSNNAYGSWTSSSVSLAEYAGHFCRLRLHYTYQWGGYYSKCEYQVGSLKVSNVYGKGSNISTWQHASADAATQTLDGLAEATRYHITVTSHVTSGTSHTAEAFTTVSPETFTFPTINSVKTLSGADLTDGTLLTGTLSGKSGLRVTCSENVTELTAQSSCPTLIPDSAITVYRYDQNTFEVLIDSPQTVTALDGSRVILTLIAKTAHAHEAYRDILFTLRSATAPITYAKPVVTRTLEDNQILEIPHYWLRMQGLIPDDATAHAAAETVVDSDADGDGLKVWQEYLCGTRPNDPESNLRITRLEFNEDGTLEAVAYEPTEAPLAAFEVQGKTTLDDDAAWTDADLERHRYFRVRATLK